MGSENQYLTLKASAHSDPGYLNIEEHHPFLITKRKGLTNSDPGFIHHHHTGDDLIRKVSIVLLFK